MEKEIIEKKPSRPTWKMVKELEERCQKQSDELNALKHSNDLLETELIRVRSEVETLNKKCDEYSGDIIYLKNRGFWARIFNKE